MEEEVGDSLSGKEQNSCHHSYAFHGKTELQDWVKSFHPQAGGIVGDLLSYMEAPGWAQLTLKKVLQVWEKRIGTMLEGVMLHRRPLPACSCRDFV